MFTCGPTFFATTASVPPGGGGGTPEDLLGLDFIHRGQPFLVYEINLSASDEPVHNGQPFFVRS